ncbi:unnamed protein product [Urochloa humidicola]
MQPFGWRNAVSKLQSLLTFRLQTILQTILQDHHVVNHTEDVDEKLACHDTLRDTSYFSRAETSGDCVWIRGTHLPIHDGRILPEPDRVLRFRCHNGTLQCLLQWAGLPPGDATWISVEAFSAEHPAFQLEDVLFREEGRDVMVSDIGQRRRRNCRG